MENTQENSILERITQVIANLLPTLGLQNNYLDEDDPCSGIIAAIDFAVLSIYHTMLQATTAQLVFLQDMALNTTSSIDREDIKISKQQLIEKKPKTKVKTAN